MVRSNFLNSEKVRLHTYNFLKNLKENIAIKINVEGSCEILKYIGGTEEIEIMFDPYFSFPESQGKEKWNPP